jgi:hypothetical protein
VTAGVRPSGKEPRSDLAQLRGPVGPKPPAGPGDLVEETPEKAPGQTPTPEPKSKPPAGPGTFPAPEPGEDGRSQAEQSISCGFGGIG